VRDLNRERVPGPTGRHWNASALLGSPMRRNGILNNQLYIGEIVYNRQRFVKDRPRASASPARTRSRIGTAKPCPNCVSSTIAPGKRCSAGAPSAADRISISGGVRNAHSPD
jgi:hypothetical protein